MAITLGFDVYGTLIDTQGVVTELEAIVGDLAKPFSSSWRDKQLEYAFRRGLMQNYVDFAQCTRHALDYTCQYYQVTLTDSQKQSLLECYRRLPAFSDVDTSLAQLQNQGFRLYAFSNGRASAVDELLSHANIRHYFDGIVSVDELKSFKPNPAVYRYFLRQASSDSDSAWLISSNPFDVIGSISSGMKSAWVQRSQTSVFDPWEIQPTLIVDSLNSLSQEIVRFSHG